MLFVWNLAHHRPRKWGAQKWDGNSLWKPTTIPTTLPTFIASRSASSKCHIFLTYFQNVADKPKEFNQIRLTFTTLPRPSWVSRTWRIASVPNPALWCAQSSCPAQLDRSRSLHPWPNISSSASKISKGKRWHLDKHPCEYDAYRFFLWISFWLKSFIFVYLRGCWSFSPLGLSNAFVKDMSRESSSVFIILSFLTRTGLKHNGKGYVKKRPWWG